MRIYIILALFLFSSKTFSQVNFGELTADGGASSGSFMPSSGKYIVSGWVKEIHSSQQVANYSSYIEISVTGTINLLNINLYSKGAIIDGWQRIVGVIEIPSLENATDPVLEVKLNCNNITGNECYFDDIRFYPFNGNMKSFVYDENTQRLMAELDENNYATFYEYDLEGGLVRVKKETEEGVFTIQETRSNNPKND